MFAFKVRPVVTPKLNHVPLTVLVHVPEPIVRVLVVVAEELKVVNVTLLLLASRVPEV